MILSSVTCDLRAMVVSFTTIKIELSDTFDH